MKHLDQGLTAEQLNDKYNPAGYGEHPVWTRCEWRIEVGNEDTLVGYWTWVQYQIGQEVENETTDDEPDDTPSIENCDDAGTGEGRYHGRI